MSPQETSRTASSGQEAEASRVRLRLLEAFWAGSSLGARERRARLDAVLQESVAHLDPQTRERVVERVLEDLARWAPAADASASAAAGDGGVLKETLLACLAHEAAPAEALPPEEQRLVDCVRLMVEHLTLESQQHILLLKEVVRDRTVSLPIEFLQALQAAAAMEGNGRVAAGGEGAGKEIERLRQVLRDMLLGWNLLLSGARAATGKALQKLADDLSPGRVAGAGKQAWEELERIHEEVASLTPEDLCDRYFSDFYRKEIKSKKGTHV